MTGHTDLVAVCGQHRIRLLVHLVTSRAADVLELVRAAGPVVPDVSAVAVEARCIRRGRVRIGSERHRRRWPDTVGANHEVLLAGAVTGLAVQAAFGKRARGIAANRVDRVENILGGKTAGGAVAHETGAFVAAHIIAVNRVAIRRIVRRDIGRPDQWRQGCQYCQYGQRQGAPANAR